MTKDRVIHCTLTVLPLALLVGCWWMVPFFSDPNPVVALTAVAGWVCFVVAIRKMPLPGHRPRGRE